MAMSSLILSVILWLSMTFGITVETPTTDQIQQYQNTTDTPWNGQTSGGGRS